MNANKHNEKLDLVFNVRVHSHKNKSFLILDDTARLGYP
jgi:hypothetical protein